MEEKENTKEIEVPTINKLSLSIKDENDNLIDNNSENSVNNNNENGNYKESLLSNEKSTFKESKIKIFLKKPLIIKFFFLLLIFAVIITLIYTIFYLASKPNFKIVDLEWDNVDKNDRKYENYIFDNGLEVLLVQDQLFDRDGASIVIGKGYLDNPKDEVIASIATHLLDAIAFWNKKEIFS